MIFIDSYDKMVTLPWVWTSTRQYSTISRLSTRYIQFVRGQIFDFRMSNSAYFEHGQIDSATNKTIIKMCLVIWLAENLQSYNNYSNHTLWLVHSVLGRSVSK